MTFDFVFLRMAPGALLWTSLKGIPGPWWIAHSFLFHQSRGEIFVVLFCKLFHNLIWHIICYPLYKRLLLEEHMIMDVHVGHNAIQRRIFNETIFQHLRFFSSIISIGEVQQWVVGSWAVRHFPRRFAPPCSSAFGSFTLSSQPLSSTATSRASKRWKLFLHQLMKGNISYMTHCKIAWNLLPTNFKRFCLTISMPVYPISILLYVLTSHLSGASICVFVGP